MMEKEPHVVRSTTPFSHSTVPLSWLAWLALPLAASSEPAEDGSAKELSQEPVDYAIVVTGGELLSGAYADGHTFFLTRTLRPLGLRCAGSMSVDDRKADIDDALRFALKKARLVIVTGGLGPTDNDVTRPVLSEFTGIVLREHPEVLAAMARRFRVAPDRLRKNLRWQTQVPEKGTYLKNPNGTSVGLVFELADAVIVALPGPPRELQAMTVEELVPYLSRRFGTRLPGCSLTLRFVGLGQSQIDLTLEEHVPLPSEVTVSSQFDGGRVDFTFSLPNDTPKDRSRLEKLKEAVLEHLGDHVYADDETSLEGRVVELLTTRGQTLALAEAASGGSLAAGLSGAEGADRALIGAYVAPAEDSLRALLRVPDDEWAGASSDAKTRLLAEAAAEATASDWVIAVGRSRSDPSGAGYVEVVFRRPDGRFESQRARLRGSSDEARRRLNTQILDRLRRELK
ncbi:MAG: molybdopterin-binding protein [Planctomycetota bacterium]|jgi:nicotinamide-nucleotide amidase